MEITWTTHKKDPLGFLGSDLVGYGPTWPLIAIMDYPEIESIAEACELLERDPKIKNVCVITKVDDLEQVLIEVNLHDDNDDYVFELRDRLFEIDVWRRFGRAAQSSSSLEILLGEGGINGEHLAEELLELEAAARCIDAFFEEAKHSKSVEFAFFNLTGLSMNDLVYFILNNKGLKTLGLESEEMVYIEQITALSRAIGGVQLETLNMEECLFENDGALELILEGCTTLDRLMMTCKYNMQCSAVAALLRDPASTLRVLEMILAPDYLSSLDFKRVEREISESLQGNTHLKELRLYGPDETNHFESNKHFDRLLCDVSSIESISNSNNTLAKLLVYEHAPSEYIKRCLSTLAKQCLEINKNEDKATVVHDKIRQFYFTGEFDVSPFTKMPLSAIPNVLSRIEGRDKHSAIYRFLKCIPELCNILEGKSTDTDQCGNNKRQKIGK
jgi:hypothetical protein